MVHGTGKRSERTNERVTRSVFIAVKPRTKDRSVLRFLPVFVVPTEQLQNKVLILHESGAGLDTGRVLVVGVVVIVVH